MMLFVYGVIVTLSSDINCDSKRLHSEAIRFNGCSYSAKVVDYSTYEDYPAYSHRNNLYYYDLEFIGCNKPMRIKDMPEGCLKKVGK